MINPNGYFNDDAMAILASLKGEPYDDQDLDSEDGWDEEEEPLEAMALSSLRSIAGNAEETLDNLDEDRELPDWLKAKITLAADYMSVVRDFIINGEES